MRIVSSTYVLSLVSIMVIYVHESRPGEVHSPFDLRAALKDIPGGAPSLESFRTQETAGQPEPVTVPPGGEEEAAVAPSGAGDAPAGRTDDTFEGLDEKIGRLDARARANPDLYIDVAECYNIKAVMYRAKIAQLREREASAGPQEKFRLANEQVLLEGRRVDCLLHALAALNKTPRSVYPDTDVRWLKALIYLDLPGRARQALAELGKVAADREALPALREQARARAQELEAKLGE